MAISLLSPKKILTRKERNTPSPSPSSNATVAAAAAATSKSSSTTTTTTTTTTLPNNKPHYILSPPKARNPTATPNPQPKYTSLLPKLDVRSPTPPPAPPQKPPQIIHNSAPNSEDSSLYDSSPSSPKIPNQSIPISPLKAPRLNYSNDSYSISSSTSQHRRNLSDKIKTTPSSFVRQSRIYSNLDFDINSNPSLTSLTGKSLLLQNKLETDNLPPELIPIVNLINAHKLRTYALGTFQIPAILNDGEKAWLEVEAKLSGNELAIWRPNVDEEDDDDDIYIVGENDEFKPRYINLIDSRVEIGHDLQIQIVHDFQIDNKLLIKFNQESDFIKWISAINLSKFEYISLNESFTASILSYKGTKLSDLHVLLSSKKRFPKYEWCNIRFPQISAKYLKVYVGILPSDAKNSLGRIEIYSSDKVQKKNLIAYINQLDSVFNVYPEHSSMIDFNPIMKLNGEIYINKSFEYLFYNEPLLSKTTSSSPPPPPSKLPTRVDSTHSLSSVTFASPSSPAPHSRNVSVNSTTSSFFNYAPSPKVDDVSISPKKNSNNNRNRSVSSPAKILSGSGYFTTNSNSTPMTNTTTSTSLNSSKSSTSSFFKKHINNFVLADFVYIIPISHPGVSPIETMIRNFIPIIDAFKLYGRPQHLISDKTNEQSLLFALPSLPRYQYINDVDSQSIIDKNLELINEDWNDVTWRQIYKNFITQKYLNNTSQKYAGFGNIHDLYNDLDLNLQEISSPRILLPKVGSNESDNFSDILIGFNGTANNTPSRTTSPLPATPQQPVQQQTSTSMVNSNLLGDPIQLPPRHVSSPLSSVYTNNDNVVPTLAPPSTSAPTSINHNINNLKLNEEDLHNYSYPNNYSTSNDRSLDPIADMPTPLDEIHAYPNLVDLKLGEN
ncbi:hypothetical protein DFJ63DRAFT_334040 [Scheffersomyces coipomensis]|uniref:uncharacterized protein n=1 Tax=Scheffersomyces coipomensis TaxID=1788519 RepID=UPI00315D0C6A